ncbi:MAG: hypothetical protein HQ517_18485, partial [SAR324 cluster bacterium]|nr:hypothetical protein [SAR324 cluster bacterium]
MKKIILVVIILLFSNPALSQSPGSFRSKETHGLGFGMEGAGLSIFYDLALFEYFQLHFFSSAMSRASASFFGNNKIETSNSLAGLTIRMFPNSDSGFFIGLGTGASSATQTVTQSTYCSSYFTSSNPSEC